MLGQKPLAWGVWRIQESEREELDGSDFFNGACDIRPEIGKGTIVERPEQVWWVRRERRGGGRGWTSEPDKFDNKDAYGQQLGARLARWTARRGP